MEYLSRADSFANYETATAAPSDYEMTAEAKATFLNTDNFNPDEFNNPGDAMPVIGASNGVVLKDLRGLAYDDSKWDYLLDEMTVADMDNLIALGGYQTYPVNRIGKVTTFDFDGPVNIVNNFTGVASIGFPSEVIIASTFNKELAEQFGDSIGTMANEMDTSGWYAPGMNCHRSAFDGRNFEYYSEDGVLGGLVCTDGFHWFWYMDSDQAMRGGSDMTLKNFDMETNHVSDQTSATSVLAMRNASHDILYMVVNSRAYDEANLNSAPPAWRIVMTAADAVVAVLVLGLGYLAVRKYRKETAQ